MKDTSLKIERKFRKMLLERSGEERLKMGCSMHAASRALVKATISKKDRIAVNRALFLRFYGEDFAPKQREKILLTFRKVAQGARNRKRKIKRETRKGFSNRRNVRP